MNSPEKKFPDTREFFYFWKQTKGVNDPMETNPVKFQWEQVWGDLSPSQGSHLLSCHAWRQTVRWGGADVWRLTSASRQTWRQVIFFLKKNEKTLFWGGKNEKNPFFLWKRGHSQAAEAQYMPTVHHWWDAQSKQTRQTYLFMIGYLGKPNENAGQRRQISCHLVRVYMKFTCSCGMNSLDNFNDTLLTVLLRLARVGVDLWLEILETVSTARTVWVGVSDSGVCIVIIDQDYGHRFPKESWWWGWTKKLQILCFVQNVARYWKMLWPHTGHARGWVTCDIWKTVVWSIWVI
jgi:hypothetical protein